MFQHTCFNLHGGLWIVSLLCCMQMSCTCDQHWSNAPGQNNTCAPQSSSFQQHPDSQALTAMLAQKPNGIEACLQLAWGSGFIENSQSRLVWFKADGSVYTRHGNQQQVPSQILPKTAEGKALRFRLFVFAADFQGNKQSYCTTTMSLPGYDCLNASEKNTCLSFFEFRPIPQGNTSTTFAISNHPNSTCHLYLRPHKQPEQSNELVSPKENLKDTTSPDETWLTPEEISPERSLDGGPDVAEHVSRERSPDAGTVEEPSPERPEPVPEQPVCTASTASQCPWIRVAGGKGHDQVLGVAVATNGDIYIAGTIQSDNVQIGTLTTPRTYGGRDVFVAKLDAKGNWLWARIAGSSTDDEVWAMDLDRKTDTLYIGGHFTSAATFGTFTLSTPIQKNGSRDIFVAKLDAQGNWLWVKRGTGENHDQVTSLKVGPQGNVFVGGFFSVDLTLGTIQHSREGWNVMFLAKLDSQGKWLWSKPYHTNTRPLVQSNYVRGYGPSLAITDQHQGLLYVGGKFGKGAAIGPYKPRTNNILEAFVAATDLNGQWKWLLRVNSPDSSNVSDIISTPSGDAVVIGGYHNEITFGSFTLKDNSRNMTYVAAINAKGAWKWATRITGNKGGCRGSAVAVDTNNHVYISGYFGQICTFGQTTLSNRNGVGLFVAKLNNQQQWSWAIRGGGPYPGQPFAGDSGLAITTCPPDTLVVGGVLQQPVIGKYSTTSPIQDLQLFVAKNIHQ